MGNQNSMCCIQKNLKAKQKDAYSYKDGYPEKPHMPTTQSNSNLQHISDREPEDNFADPSSNPLATTIFLTRSKSEIHKNNKLKRRSHYYEMPNHRIDLGHLTRKYSSCSTIFIDDSTVCQPNLKNTVKAVALAIYFHIRNRTKTSNSCDLDIFDERLHPLTREVVPEDYYKRDPDHKTIYRFVRTLFNAAQLTAECAIVTLVYLERLLTNAEIDLAPCYWKRIILGAILLASKVWDDQAVWNVDYCQILKDMTIEDMNELERQYLEILQFNINVPSSVYAKYYFDLRAVADAHDLSFPLEALSKARALKLEAMSNLCEDRIKKSGLKRSSSLDRFTAPSYHNKAILS